MPARLFCKTGELAGSAYAIGREATIGRLVDNQITLYPSYVSGYHARIYFDDAEDRYFLEDFNSSNGTELDGVPVSEPVRLDQLHVITFAHQVDFIFLVAAEASASDFSVEKTPVSDDLRDKTYIGDIFAPLPALPGLDAEDAGEMTPLPDPFDDLQTPVEPPDSRDKTTFHDAFSPMPSLDLPSASAPTASEDAPGDGETAPEPAAEPAQFTLVVTMPDETAEVFSLVEGAQIVGRELSCDLTIPDTSISRRHARITVEAGTVMLEDLGSKNATFVDGQKLTTSVAIHPDSLIRFGLSIEASLEHAS